MPKHIYVHIRTSMDIDMHLASHSDCGMRVKLIFVTGFWKIAQVTNLHSSY